VEARSARHPEKPTLTYETESKELDAEILGIIEAWHQRGQTLSDDRFNDLALRLFAYQIRYNEPYARTWEDIPGVPAAAFKEASVTTFDPSGAGLTFETSGTTRGVGGLHYMESASLYDAALLAGFDRFVLSDSARLRYFNLVPDPAERTRSSLGYMMGRIAADRGDGATRWYLRGDELLVSDFERDVRAAIADRQPICIAATAFALVRVLDALAQRGIELELPNGSRIVQTGGFKGRTRIVSHDELYAGLCARFGVTVDQICAEYGMTELTSQYYARASGAYSAPPWLRTRVVGPDRKTLPEGETGSLLHLDLANRSSCIAVQTEDLGMQAAAGLVLLGRETEAPARGCSLDSEQLETQLT